MKITNELKAKIERQLDEKYQALNKANLENYQRAKSIATPAIIQELENAYNSSPIVKVVFDAKCYGGFNAESLAKDYIDRLPSMAEANKNYNDERERLKILRRNDYEMLVIAISYEKELEGIVKAFTKCGLSF